MNKKLIFDIGAHKGEDSEFYLQKGFRVVAVEASQVLCQICRDRLKHYVDSNDFKIYNYAIGDKNGEVVTFYENTNVSVWGTLNRSWVSRNEKLGTKSVAKSVEMIKLDTLIKTEGTPYYLKIDIEGSDIIALKSLLEIPDRPKFISIESEKISWKNLLNEFDIFKQLGYTKFKIVDQSVIDKQVCLLPSSEGLYVNYNFEKGSSGLFGEELPGKWLSSAEALSEYRKIFKRYKYFGDYGFFNKKFFKRSKFFKKVFKLLDIDYTLPPWYDTHATF